MASSVSGVCSRFGSFKYALSMPLSDYGASLPLCLLVLSRLFL